MYKKALFALTVFVGGSLILPELAAAQTFSWNEPIRMLRDNFVTITLPALGGLLLAIMALRAIFFEGTQGLAIIGRALLFIAIGAGAIGIVAMIVSMV